MPIFGEFGQRLAEQVERARGEVIAVNSPMGTAPSVEQIREVFERKENIKAFLLVYKDTSPGTTYRFLSNY